MSELTYSEHIDLEGTFDDSLYFGGYISELLARYNPAKDAGQNNAHFKEFINFYESLLRLSSSIFRGYVYKDSADAALQFSVRPFTLIHRGLVCTYAGGTALGPVTAGATRYIYADLSAAPTVTIAVAAALPATPHAALASIAAPASGNWLPQHLSRISDRHAARTWGGAKHMVKKAFTYQTSSPISVGYVPAGSTIVRAVVRVETTFNGTTPQVKLGDAGDDDRLMVVGDSNLGAVNKYIVQPYVDYAAQTELIATLSIGGSPSQGAATLFVEHD